MFRYLSCSAAILAASAAAASASPFSYSNDTGGSATFYGQFSPAYTSVDDGVETTDTFVDNERSNSRLGFRVFQEFGTGYRAGFRVESALGIRQSGDVSQTDTPPGVDWDRGDIRWVDLSLQTPNYGTVFLGQGSMSGDGLAEIDLSGTALVNHVQASSDLVGSFEFRNADGTLSGITISDVLTDFDASRRGRIRYDTPKFYDFTVSVSYGKDILEEDADREDFYTGASLLYDRTFANDVQFKAGIGYSRRDRRPDNGPDVTRNDVFGSASVLLPSGFSFTASLGNRETEGVSFDAQYYYLKAGYEQKWFDIGATALSIDFFAGRDYQQEDDESRAWGVGVVQKLDDANAEFYLGYRHMDYDQRFADFKAISAFIAGARVQF
ncbi:MAG: porin [Pseudomonadota bacterium]